MQYKTVQSISESLQNQTLWSSMKNADLHFGVSRRAERVYLSLRLVVLLIPKVSTTTKIQSFVKHYIQAEKVLLHHPMKNPSRINYLPVDFFKRSIYNSTSFYFKVDQK